MSLERPTADKRRLSAKRPRDTPEVADATCRLVRAIGRRVATEDPDALEVLSELERTLTLAWGDAIAGLRRQFTDGQIGDQLGVTTQAVAQRWPR